MTIIALLITFLFRYNTKEVKGNNGFKLTVEPQDLNSIFDPKIKICSTYTGERVLSISNLFLSTITILPFCAGENWNGSCRSGDCDWLGSGQS